MESLLTLPLAGEARVRILQITDTHLFAEKHETLLGVNTQESYRAVLEAIRAQQYEYDLIVATRRSGAGSIRCGLSAFC